MDAAMTTRANNRLRLIGISLAFVVACLAVLPYLSGRQANIAMESMTSVASKEYGYDKVLSLLKDAETGQRGYLLVGKESFLEPYNIGMAGLPTALEEILQQAQTKREKELVANITALSREKVIEMSKTIELKRAGRDTEALGVVAEGRGKQTMDRLRELIGAERQQIEEHKVALRDKLALSLQYNIYIGIGAGIISMAVIATGILLAASGLRRRDEAAKQSQLQAEKNAKIAEKTILHNEQLSLSAEMLQSVDSIETPDELDEIISVFLKKLFPSTTGAIYLYKNSRDVLERSAHWGIIDNDKEILQPSECWALRLGRTHQNVHGADLSCPHTGKELTVGATQLCVPMLSQGDVIGLMVVTIVESKIEAIERNFVVTIAEQLGLAINNVRLRNTLRQQSTIDPLTGLYNRRYFDESLKREMIRAQRKKTSVAIVMIDLDHFKQINDTYGHDGGDQVLREAAKRILGRIRGSDVACRYGGEEIVLLLADCNSHDASLCAEAIRSSLVEIELHNLGQTIAQVSASFGVAAWPEHAIDETELIKAADRSLYMAKKAGRNRVCIAAEKRSGTA
jgi:diguanylate cyclase (GGDEF)-like protein